MRRPCDVASRPGRGLAWRRRRAARRRRRQFPNRPPIDPKQGGGPGDARAAQAWPPVGMRTGAAAGPLCRLLLGRPASGVSARCCLLRLFRSRFRSKVARQGGPMIRFLWFGHNWFGDNSPGNGWSAFSCRDDMLAPAGMIVSSTVDNHVSIGLFPHLGKVSRENRKYRCFRFQVHAVMAKQSQTSLTECRYGTNVSVMKSVLSATFSMGR